jgi:hypothetical protein
MSEREKRGERRVKIFLDNFEGTLNVALLNVER